MHIDLSSMNKVKSLTLFVTYVESDIYILAILSDVFISEAHHSPIIQVVLMSEEITE